MGYSAMYCVREPTFRKNVSPPYHPPAARRFLAPLVLYHEDGDDMLLRNVGSHTNYTRYNPENASILHRLEKCTAFVMITSVSLSLCGTLIACSYCGLMN
jgi:hypothetical protein